MSQAIPASLIVNVNPGVLAAGGSSFDENGLLLTGSTRTPIGSVVGFTDFASVAAYFGPTSDEAYAAATYFAGYDDSTKKPGSLLFYQYPAAAVPAYLRGGRLGLTLAQLQAIAAGTMAIPVNGVTKTSGTITLSGATSFSNAAALIQTAFAAFDAVGTAAIAATTMTVSAVASGAYAVGQVLSGSGVTPGTVITALGTGTGSTGTYTVSPSQTAASTTISGGPLTVAYDSVLDAFVFTGGTPTTGTIGFAATGTMANKLNLKTGAGGVISQGAAAGDPTTAMNSIVGQTQNFACFSYLTKPNASNMVAFAAWNALQDNQFAYVMWDTDTAATVSGDTTSAGYLVRQAGYGGVIPFYQPTNTNAVDGQAGALVMGYIASFDWGRRNGRTTLAFRGQTGFVPGVLDSATATNLAANGYNYYGAFATNANAFQFLYPGSVTGKFVWADAYVGQIKLNSDLQFSAMSLLTSVNAIAYDSDGFGLVEAACQDPIDAALRFGTIKTGIQLSKLQIAAVNEAAGRIIAPDLQTRGWYLLVEDPGADVRAARGSPIITLWYTDGGSVQKLVIASIDVM